MPLHSRISAFKQWEEQNSALKLDDGNPNSETNGNSGQPRIVEPEEMTGAQRLRSINWCLIVLSAIAVLTLITYAKAIVMPTVMAVLLYLVLRPLVQISNRFALPPMIAASGILAALMAALLMIVVFMAQPVSGWMTDAPQYLAELKVKLVGLEAQMESVEEVSQQIADVTDSGNDDEVQPLAVEIKQPRFLPGLSVLTSTSGFASGLLITAGLLFFLLAYGDVLIKNCIQGIREAEDRNRARRLIFDLQYGMSSYLLTITVINAVLGVAVWLSMWLMGMPNSPMLGVMAMFFNYIPFLGAWAGTALIAVIAILQFDNMAYSLAVPLVYFLLTSLEGQFISPYVLGRSMSLNPLVVFVSIAIWGWMWGIGGVFLAVPLLAVLKIVADYFPSLHFISRSLMTRVEA